jgi:opacity protein-like surface antigen
MKTKLFLLGLLASAMTVAGQTNSTDSKPETWYFKLGGSYFMQTAATEFPTVGGNAALDRTFVGGKLVSQESITGSFGEGFRSGITAGYRFNTRLGVELGVNYYSSKDKTMAQTQSDLPITPAGVYSFKSVGQITCFDVAPALVLFLGEHQGFEPYTKVGVLVPISGDLEITTDAHAPVVFTPAGAPAAFGDIHNVDKVKPNPTIGFSAALGTSYKLAKHISLYAELEYRNFTVHSDTKETTEFTVNGTDKLATRTTSQVHTNYQDRLDVNSNNPLFNPNTATVTDSKDTTRPNDAMDELSSYVGISGLGFTFGAKFSL